MAKTIPSLLRKDAKFSIENYGELVTKIINLSPKLTLNTTLDVENVKYIYTSTRIVLSHDYKLLKNVIVISDNTAFTHWYYDEEDDTKRPVIDFIKEIDPSSQIKINYTSERSPKEGYLRNSPSSNTIKLIKIVHSIDNYEDEQFSARKYNSDPLFLSINDYLYFKNNITANIKPKIINYYIELLLEQNKTRSFICYYFKDKDQLLLLPPKYHLFDEVDIIICARNDENHLWLYYINKLTAKIYVYDSLYYNKAIGEINRHSDLLDQLLIYFPGYTIEHPFAAINVSAIPSQYRSFQSGIFCMKYAADLIKTDRRERDRWVTDKFNDVDKYRDKIVEKIAREK